VPAEGSVLREADPEWCAARAAYGSRFRSVGRAVTRWWCWPSDGTKVPPGRVLQP